MSGVRVRRTPPRDPDPEPTGPAVEGKETDDGDCPDCGTELSADEDGTELVCSGCGWKTPI